MPTPSFAELMQTMRSFQESRLLLTAIELDLFTAVGAGASASEVAKAARTHPAATETLLNALVSAGAMTKRDGLFHNTPETARHLVAGAPEDARQALMHTVNMWDSWSQLTESVRTGTAAARPGVEADDPRWTASFIAAMHRNAQTRAAEVVRAVGAESVERVLDVGGGSGAYSIAFAQQNPTLHAEVLDTAAVAPIALHHIANAGLSDRVTVRIGDLTVDDFGSGYNLVLLSSICHMLDPAGNQDLFRRCHRALTPGGRIVMADFLLDSTKTAPKPAALFAVHMLVNTRSGSCYSEDEYRAWLEGAGFRDVTRLASTVELLTARQ